MRTIGNILWFVFGGFLSGLAWIISGCLSCLTIIGIPYGLQCFKFAALSFFPFGKEVRYGGGTVSTLANIIWLLFCGFWMAIGNLGIGLLWCLTIIGIPFGRQFFKLAKLSLTPFGAEIVMAQR
ncbi:MAG: YccF domain-containing protein [Solobacterium sp.]|nr:YccF domain-containing protein [Solobacterium sp.]